MNLLLVSILAFTGSSLTFFSGFGLATILTPFLLIYFPVPVAVGMTAFVHLANNFFKLALVGRHIDRDVATRFGIPAVLAAFAGAALLGYFTAQPPILNYKIAGQSASVTPVKLMTGGLIFFFAVIESVPAFQNLAFERKHLPLGGVLSGFFGGLSGHQGALRSAFLVRLGMTKETFIGTGVAVAVMVDLARLSVYGAKFQSAFETAYFPYVAVAVMSAIAGAVAGNYFLKKVTFVFVQRTVSFMLVLLALLLASGVI